jgi:cell division protein FtsQ
VIGRKTNRRKTESRLKRLKVPKLGGVWRKAWQFVVVPALIVVVVFGAFAGMRFVLDRPVRKLVVEGTFQRVTPIQVEAAVAQGMGRGFLSLDLAALRARVRHIDWVDRVNVGRAWPDTLIVRVTEHQAAARWGENGLLNVRGELFADHAQHALPELPILDGPDGTEREVARRYLAVRGPLADADLKLESLSMDERGAWRIVLDGGHEIRLGRRDVDDRLQRFFSVVAPALAGEWQRVQYVDLRYTNGFAVGWAEPERTPQKLADASGRMDRG